MKFAQSLIPLSLSSTVLGSPTPTLEKRATTVCGQWDTIATGTFTVYQDLWGEANGSGSQCTTVTSDSSGTLVWSTSWSWSENPSDVKSYANAGLTMTATELSAISKIPTTWDWR
jgi:xyloglucan-specific endo-beta-1,4-glucanase